MHFFCLDVTQFLEKTYDSRVVMRTVIIGNSGSGKTWSVKKLSSIYAVPIIHFDEIFWEPGGFDKKRESIELLSLIDKSKRMSSWIAEGVFGKTAEHYLEGTDAFIWLNIPLETCIELNIGKPLRTVRYLKELKRRVGLGPNIGHWLGLKNGKYNFMVLYHNYIQFRALVNAGSGRA